MFYKENPNLEYAFSRQRRAQFSEDVYAFVLWRYVALHICREYP